MANYNVGNIEIGVILKDSTVSTKLNNITSALQKLQNVKLDDDKLQAVFKSLDGLSKIDMKNFSNIANSLRQFSNSIKTLEKVNNLDMRGLYKNFSSLNRLIQPFLNSIKEVELALQSFSNILTRLSSTTDLAKIFTGLGKLNKLDNLYESLKKLESLKTLNFKNIEEGFNQLLIAVTPFLEKLKGMEETLRSFSNLVNVVSQQSKTAFRGFNFKKIFNIGMIYFLYNYSQRIIRVFSKFVTYASDYIEILNKFKVSFGDLYETNVKSVNQLAQAFGFSTNTLLDYTATFNNMLKGLRGLTNELSADISQTLTRMAIDFSSLFNIDLKRSMEAFSSALAGNIRTLRTISGFDVSEITIYSLYQELGGTKSMRQLNQLEKRLLRILAIQKQMEATGALGDYGRTIETVSNQLKILKENAIEVGKWMGMNLLVYVKPIIQYLNGLLIILKEISKSFANLKEQTEDIDYSKEFASLGDSFSDATESVEELENALNSLLGFDQLNILNSNASAIGVEGLTVEGSILEALREYNMNLDKVNYKAKEISSKFLTWAGYVQELDEETGEYIWVLGEGENKLAKIKAILGTIIPMIISLSVGSKISGALTALSKSGKSVSDIFKTFSKSLNPTVLIITAIIGLVTYLYKTNEDVKNSLNNLFSALVKVLKIIFDNIVSIFKALMPIINVIIDLLPKILVPIIDAIMPIIDVIVNLLEEILPLIVPIIDALLPIINALVDIIKTLLPPLTQILNIIVKIAVWLIEKLTPYIKNNINIFISLFNLLLPILEFLLVIVQKIIEYFIVGTDTVLSFFETVGKTIGKLFKKEFNEIGDLWYDLGQKLKNIWGNIWKSMRVPFINFLNGVIQNFAKFVNSISKFINQMSDDLSSLYEWTGIPPIPHIPEWHPTPIALASGGIITKPTHALVGEYAGAKSNPEIVTPENLMRKVFTESMLPLAQAIINGNTNVVSAIDDLADRPIELNGRKVSEAIYNDFNQVVKRKTGKGFGFAK